MSRRAVIQLIYENVDVSTEISGYLLDLSYSDNGTGKVDDLQISIEDRSQLWQGDWMAKKGDTLKAAIQTLDWNDTGEDATLYCGTFEIDGYSIQGPPDVLQIKAVSLPFDSSIRFVTKTKVWENVSLRRIAQDIASVAGFELLFLIENPPPYDRVEQSDQSDLSFLQELAEKEGAAMKLTDNQLILFDEALFEQKDPVAEIVRGASDVISYSFSEHSADSAYVACTVRYNDPKKGLIQATYRVPDAPDDGPVLQVKEQVKSIAEAERLAKKRLREKNKEAAKASMELAGNVSLVTGVTIKITGWFNFDGKYIVTSAKHSVNGSGYKTSIEIHKVLEGY